MYNRLLLSAAVAAGIGALAFADHINGHNDDDPIHPVPIPGQEFFDGGVMFVTAIGPVGGREVIEVDMDITYVSDGTTPASEIVIEVGMLVEDNDGVIEYQSFHVTGGELGFGSGPGRFHGTFSTDALNGFAVQGFLPPYSIVDLMIGSVNGGIQGSGYFEDSFANFMLTPIGCPADLDGDGDADADDFFSYLDAFAADELDVCDIDGDGDCDADDFFGYLDVFAQGC